MLKVLVLQSRKSAARDGDTDGYFGEVDVDQFDR